MQRGLRRACLLPAACAALLLASGCQGGSERLAAGEQRCTIDTVTDGDTVRCADGRRVRLLSIDAPEMQQVPWGAESRDQLLRLVQPGTVVQLELDRETTDRYGRTLAYLFDGSGRLINEQMASAGYAVDLIYEPNTRYAEAVRAAVGDARAAGRGLWGRGGFGCLPRDFRAERCQ